MDFRTITPLERPAELAEKAVLTAEEAAEYQALENRRQNRDLVDPEKGGALYPPESQGGVVPYNELWYDRGNTLVEDRRTSLIVDPPDGRMPARRPGALEQIGSAGEDLPGSRPVRYRAGGIGADGPEDRGLGERCLLGFNSGPPLIPSAYNNNIQVFQTPTHVVVHHEMVHDARIVPLDGRRTCPTRSASGWATGGGAGKATRWWSRPPTSPTGPRASSPPSRARWGPARR